MLFSPRGFGDLTGQWSGEGRICYRSCQVNIERTGKQKQNSFAARKQADEGNGTQHEHFHTKPAHCWNALGFLLLLQFRQCRVTETVFKSTKSCLYFAFSFDTDVFQTTTVKLSQCSVSNLTLSADGKRRKPVQLLSLYISVSPAWYNIIYVVYVSDQTVRQQQQKQQQQGDPVSVKTLMDGGLLAQA